MTIAQHPAKLCGVAPVALDDPDIADRDLLGFALAFADKGRAAPAAGRLLSEFGNVDVILASDPDELRALGGLSDRAVAILKLLHAFRTGARRDQLLH